MWQVSRTIFPAILFICIAIAFAYTNVFFAGVIGFSWLGGILLLNLAAPKLPFSRAINWAYAMTFELLALLAVAVMRLIPMKEMALGRGGRPILLVHGYMNHGSVWRFPKKRLEALGLGPIYTISLGHPFRSIRWYAEKVKAKAELIAQETGRKDLILIGHSMGGLVSSWYATQIAPALSVTDVITIGSPLFGTPMAHIGLGENAREMEPNSPFLEILRAGIAQKKEIRFYHIATKSDQLVIPGSSAVIPENEHFIFEDIGHASLLYSREVTDQIGQWLRKS